MAKKNEIETLTSQDNTSEEGGPADTTTVGRNGKASVTSLSDESAVPSIQNEEALFKALVSCSKKRPDKIILNDAEREVLVNHVIRDFQDADAGNTQYKQNMTEMLA